MTGAEIAFVVIGVAAVVGAFRVVTARNVVRAALYLVITLSGVAGVSSRCSERMSGEHCAGAER